MQVLAGRELLRRVTASLAPVPVVALKGVVLSALTEGTAEPPRRMIDVDVLIPAEARAEAERRLEALGLHVIARSASATTLRDAELGLDLDLHVRLSEPGLFALDEPAILARARPDPRRFGFDALVPDRHDLYAHLVAHFVRNRSNASDSRRLHDFTIVARHLPMSATAVAARLRDFGLARAARYALGLAAEAGDTFASHVLTELPNDPLGARLARVAYRWLRRTAGNDARAIPVPHLLNRDLGAGAASLARHLTEATRRRATRARTTTSG